jgi:hypothetical protein
LKYVLVAKPLVAAAGRRGNEGLTDAEKKLRDEAYKIKADNVKDYTNVIVNNGMYVARDQTKSLLAGKAKDIPEKIDWLFQDIVEKWQESLTAMNRAVFSGDEQGIGVLTNLIHNGNSLSRQAAVADVVQGHATKFLVSMMVPEVWRMQGYYPVLLDTAFPCGVTGIGIRQWTNQKNVGEAEVCMLDEGGINRDGKPFSGGRQYQLWAVKGGWNDNCLQNSNPRQIHPCNHYMTQLPGLKDIRDPVGEWNKLSIFDMINK